MEWKEEEDLDQTQVREAGRTSERYNIKNEKKKGADHVSQQQDMAAEESSGKAELCYREQYLQTVMIGSNKPIVIPQG